MCYQRASPNRNFILSRGPNIIARGPEFDTPALDSYCRQHVTLAIRKSLPHHSVHNRFKSYRFLQTKSNLVCLHRQKQMLSLASIVALSPDWRYPNVLTLPYSSFSNTRLRQLVKKSVINCYYYYSFFIYISRQNTCYWFTSFEEFGSCDLLRLQDSKSQCARCRLWYLSAVSEDTKFNFALEYQCWSNMGDFCFTFSDLKKLGNMVCTTLVDPIWTHQPHFRSLF